MFVWFGTNFIKYFNAQGIRFQLGLQNSIGSGVPIFVICNTHLGEPNRDMHQHFGKTPAGELYVNLGGPAGGEAPGKVLRPKVLIIHDS